MKLEPDRIFVRDGDIWSSAGISAGIDLALAIVGEDFGDKVAKDTARQLVCIIAAPAANRSSRRCWNCRRRPAGSAALLGWVREHLDQRLTVDDLADRAGMSARHFTRAFIAETGISPSKAVERLRIEAAKARVQASAESIEQVAAITGFRDPERMRRAFIRAFGQPPQALRRASRSATGTKAVLSRISERSASRDLVHRRVLCYTNRHVSFRMEIGFDLAADSRRHLPRIERTQPIDAGP